MRYVHVAIILSVWLLYAVGAQAPAPRLDVVLVFSGTPVRPRLLATAVAEARRVWAPYGVDVRALAAGDTARSNAIPLRVTLSTDHGPARAVRSLGSTLFNGDAPEPAIVLYPAAVTDLVSLAARDEGRNGWPTEYREVIEGRALGRALAHEIGHVLMRSRQHTATGLMRACQSIADLMTAECNKFFLSPRERARLALLTGGLSVVSSQ